MKIQFRDLNQITPALYNPKARTTNRNLTSLSNSVKKHGIIIPLLVDGNGNLIDGHRRLQTAKNLKLKQVPTIQVDSKVTKEEAYEIVNTNSKRLSNKDMIYIYLNGGTVSESHLKRIKAIESIVGKTELKKMAEKSVSTSILRFAEKVQRYCKVRDAEFLKKTVLWLAYQGMSYLVSKAMQNNADKSTIVNAINKKKPLKIAYL